MTEDQLQLLPDPGYDSIGKFHRPDAGAPETERGAAIFTYPRTGTKRRQALDFVARRGDRGATDEEISLGCSMRLYTAAPRRNELVSDGWLEDSGIRRKTTTGARAAVWVLTELGRQQWASLH